jgi:general secretion pathway protein J
VSTSSLRGVTLLEVLVSVTILAMIGTMIYASFDQTAKLRERLSTRQEHDHQARIALARVTRDLRAAFLSLHTNQNTQLAAAQTAFKGATSLGQAQVDMTTFTHRRLRSGTHEGDACEVGYRVEERRGPTPDGRRVLDLLRRESPRIDADPLHGGVVDVLMTDVKTFELAYWDEPAERWSDTWDTQSGTGQPGRLPLRVRVTLTVEEGPQRDTRRYSTETHVMMTRPLTFGLPIY